MAQMYSFPLPATRRPENMELRDQLEIAQVETNRRLYDEPDPYISRLIELAQELEDE